MTRLSRMTSARSGALRLLRRLGAFSVSTALMGVVNVLSIPFIVQTQGADAWGAIALGQAIGTLGATITVFGWGVIGPATVAAQGRQERRREYSRSLVTRLVIYPVASAASFVVSVFLASNYGLEAGLAAVATCTIGLSANWFFVGSSEPGRLFLYDTLPRLSAVVAATVLLVLTGNLWSYPALLFVGAISCVVFSSINILRSCQPVGQDGLLRPFRELDRSQLHGLGIGLSSSVYQALPTVVVALLVPGVLPQFALADRLLKLSSTALKPVSQLLQGWVPTHGRPSRQRVLRALTLALLAGLVASSLLYAAGPTISRILGNGAITLPNALVAPVAVTLLLTCLSQCVGLACLPALGRSRDVLYSALLGALVSVPLCLLLALSGGAVGVAWAVAGAEVAVLAFQLRSLFRALRS